MPTWRGGAGQGSGDQPRRPSSVPGTADSRAFMRVTGVFSASIMQRRASAGFRWSDRQPTCQEANVVRSSTAFHRLRGTSIAAGRPVSETQGRSLRMGVQASAKRGVKSSARKAASSRHGIDPQPRSQPVAGAFGWEAPDRQTPRSAGPLKRRSRLVASRRMVARGMVGISNLSPEGEQREQRRLPPRWHRRGR
jgi:hypothetical protein